MSPQQVQAAYVTAYDVARSELGADHPIRTGIAPNYAVISFEIAGNNKAAIQIAKSVHDEGIARVKRRHGSA
jgi:hypothetical protein